MSSAIIEPRPAFNKIYYTVGSLISLALLFTVRQYNFLLFHGIAELFSIVVAWSVFVLVWNTRRIVRNDSLLFLGIAFFFIGLIDLTHTLVYKGMGLFPEYPGANYATQLWIAARFIEAISMLLYPLFINRRVRTLFVIGIYTVLTALIIASIFSWNVFPDCYIDGQGLTVFKKVSEYIISLTIAVAIALLFRKRNQLNTQIFHLMVGAMVFTIASELAFTFYVSVFGLSNVAGHFLKIISFYLVYLALVRSSLTQPYTTLFRNLEKEKAVLKENEKQLKRAQQTAKIGNWIWYIQENKLWWSDEMYNIFDIDKDSFTGKLDEVIERAIHPDDKQAVEQSNHSVMVENKPIPVEYRINTRDGEQKYVLGIADKITLDEKGRSKSLSGIVKDITDYKLVQIELIRSKEKAEKGEAILSRTNEMAKVGGWEFDLVNNKIFWTLQTYRIHELDPSIEPGLESGIRFYASEARPIIEAAVQTAVKDGTPYDLEVPFITSKGRHIWVRTQGSAIIKDHKVIKLVGSIQDITVRKQIEIEKQELQQQLHHKRKMDSIGELAGGMAHDFNNVLNGIMSASQLLRLPKSGLNEKNLKYAEMITQASIRASDLISKLLAFSRKGKIVTSTLNIHEILNDVVAILERTIDKKITISVTNNAPNHYLIGDHSAMLSALLNLGINASHAMPDGGEMYVKTENIPLDQEHCDSSSFDITPGEFLKIEIKDTGCGIPQENLQKIFDPFYTTKEQGRGTGLGLSAVYGTIQDHHGSIEVQSEVGIGTTFNILIPCTTQLNEQVEDIRPVKTGFGTILLVDDEEMNRILNKDILESLGYKVLLAEDGLESIEIFSEKHTEIDIVLMDMIMPKMNGSEAFYKMKEIDENCKIIIASGYTQDENIDEFKIHGLAGFINKPYKISDISQLLDKIQNKK